jgi:iron complex transport system substrate-binding protein
MKNRSIRILSILLAAFLLVSTISGCGSQPTAPTSPTVTATPSPTKTTSPTTSASPSAKPATVTITDMTGRQVTMPAPENIKRVAVQTSPQVLEAYAIGIQDKLCAVTNAVKMWDLLTKVDPRLKDVPATRAGNAQINIEALLQTNPDVCIGGEMDMQVIEKSTNLPTLRISQGAPGAYFDQLKKEMSFFGSVFGKDSRVKTYNSYLDNMLNTVKTTTADLTTDKKMKVFMAYNADHLTTFGNDTFMNEWIQAAGCVNSANISSIGGKEGGLATVSLEQILSWNPDIIIIDTGKPEDLYNDATWSKLTAVKNKKVYRLPLGVFIWNRPSCEAGVMLPKWLSLTAYPSKFANTDIKSEIKKFYSDVFQFNFTDDDINKMLNPS